MVLRGTCLSATKVFGSRQARGVLWSGFPAQLSPVLTQSLQGSPCFPMSASASSAQQLLLCVPWSTVTWPRPGWHCRT